MAMSIENISKKELEIIIEALDSYKPRHPVEQMVTMALEAKEKGAKNPAEATAMMESRLKAMQRKLDQDYIEILQLKGKLHEINDRAAEFEVPDPEKK